jgi:hypothetical protein
MQIKMVPGDSAGIVTAFYVRNIDSARGFHQQLGSANVGHCVNMPTTRLNITGPVLVDIYC